LIRDLRSAMRRQFVLDGPYDLARSLLLGDRGGRDPTLRWLEPERLLRASRTPEGPVTFELARTDGLLQAEAWGPGAAWLLDALPSLLGLDDRPPRFVGKLGRVQRELPGVRITRAVDLFEVLVSYVIRQRVAWRDAVASQLAILRAHAEPAPGPGELRLPLSPEQWRSLTTADLAGFEIERKRASTILALARRADRIRSWAALPSETFAMRLEALPGIGPWTRAMVQGHALGELDAVPLGDYELPSAVAWFFTGEPRADDARMLELLEPYAGQRFRVLRLLWAAGVHAPRFGPRKRATPFR
jgi:3-methyladenine DNA glycosylase/8-oxoguanine DNA glycosylase